MSFQLSQNTPKNHVDTKEDVYLRVRNNIVSEEVRVETKDLCHARIKLSMKVDFIGDAKEDKYKWFSIDNYVKLLCDRIGSMLKNHIRKLFYA
ncbi:MAG: hypothetical protein P8X92_02410 [Dehalococcoidia bacterium]